jgi:hypothetical protein
MQRFGLVASYYYLMGLAILVDLILDLRKVSVGIPIQTNDLQYLENLDILLFPMLRLAAQ